jgi:hypothetical protein
VSLYEVANLPIEKKSNPLHLGRLNNLAIRIAYIDGELVLSITDGGHRAWCLNDIAEGKKLKKVKYEAGVSPDSTKAYNEMFAERTIFDANGAEDLRKMMDEAILPVIFAGEDFDASCRNNTRTQSGNDKIALKFKENALWLYTKKLVVEKKLYLEKDVDGSAIAILFTVARAFGIKSDKFSGVRFLLNNFNSEAQCEFIGDIAVHFCKKAYNNEKLFFLKKDNGYYNTYKLQAFLLGIQSCLLYEYQATRIYSLCGAEYEEAKAARHKDAMNGKVPKTFCEYVQSKYLAHRTAKYEEYYYAIAEDTLAYIDSRFARIAELNAYIQELLRKYDKGYGHGHKNDGIACCNEFVNAIIFNLLDKEIADKIPPIHHFNDCKRKDVVTVDA